MNKLKLKKNIRMNLNKIFIFLTFLVLMSCSSSIDLGQKDASTVGTGGWSFEGWGGPPDQRADGKTPKDTEPRDWYYMKFPARASAKAVNRKSQAMMQSTCREGARLQGAADVIKKMVGETIESTSGVSDGETTANVIVSESRGLVKGVGVYECKAIGPGSDPIDVTKDNWEECQCVIYAKYKGGREALVGEARKIEQNS